MKTQMLHARFDPVTVMTIYMYIYYGDLHQLFAAVEDVFSCPTDSVCCYYQTTTVEGEAGTSGRAHMSTQPAEGTIRFVQIQCTVQPHGSYYPFCDCYCVSTFLQRKRESRIFLRKGKLCSTCTVSNVVIAPPLAVVELK